MTTLKELREQWESGLEVVLVIPIQIGDFKKVFVILRKGWLHRLHRYFQGGGGDSWHCSVVDKESIAGLDVSGHILEHISKDRDIIRALAEITKDEDTPPVR
jgi:hypothetical protein